ncbi:MAG: universal stress protein, partial [Candidatus Thermoplasmatota archaeon]|nr:universal stress protein [Candidatus Thermoplasmatota archaeon]
MDADALTGWVQDRLRTLGLSLPGTPPRPERALVGFDGGSRSQDAARWAGALAREVLLVTAMPDHPSGAHGTGPITRRDAASWAEGTRAMVRQALPDTVDALGDRHVERLEEVGSPVRVLQRLLEEQDAQLLVVGTVNRGWMDRAVLGSVSESLLHHARVATLLADEPPGPGPIIAAVGRDKGSALSAGWGAAIAGWLNRELLLAHAAPGDGPPRFEDKVDGAEAITVAWPPRRGVVHLAEQRQASLIVTGHGLSPGWVGSKAVAISRTAPCSVL